MNTTAQQLGDGPTHLVLVDNFDSFTWNLAQALAGVGARLTVVRNDAVTPDDDLIRDADGIVISPGPGTPADAGVSIPMIAAWTGRKPILGICLGHQAIAEAHGATVSRAPELKHGKASSITHDGNDLFAGVVDGTVATRYHSLAVEPDTLGEDLVATAHSEAGIIMALRHQSQPVFGLQFHPESVLTTDGPKMLANFVEIVRAS